MQMCVGRAGSLSIKTNKVICFLGFFFFLSCNICVFLSEVVICRPISSTQPALLLSVFLSLSISSPSCSRFPLILLSLTFVPVLPLSQTCQPLLPLLCSHSMFHNFILCPSVMGVLRSVPCIFLQLSSFGSRHFIHMGVSRSQRIPSFSFWSPHNISFVLHMTACLAEIFEFRIYGLAWTLN